MGCAVLSYVLQASFWDLPLSHTGRLDFHRQVHVCHQGILEHYFKLPTAGCLLIRALIVSSSSSVPRPRTALRQESVQAFSAVVPVTVRASGVQSWTFSNLGFQLEPCCWGGSAGGDNPHPAPVPGFTSIINSVPALPWLRAPARLLFQADGRLSAEPAGSSSSIPLPAVSTGDRDTIFNGRLAHSWLPPVSPLRRRRQGLPVS